MSHWSPHTHLKRHRDLHSRWFCTKGMRVARCWVDCSRMCSSSAASWRSLVSFHRTGGETQMPSWGPHHTEPSRDLLFSLVLHFPMTAVLADSLEMWDMAMDAEDSVLKTFSKPEPPETPAISVLKNHMETQNRIPPSLCHQNPQAQSGPCHLQTSSLNQDTTGTSVLGANTKGNLGVCDSLSFKSRMTFHFKKSGLLSEGQQSKNVEDN